MRIAILGLVAAISSFLLGATASAEDSPWTLIYDAHGADIATIEMFDDQLGLASTNTTLLRTTDGGATWDIVPSAVPRGVAAFGFADRQRVWAVSYSEDIARSDDGGQTWVTQLVDPAIALQSIAVISATEAWAAGFGGEVALPPPVATPPADVQAQSIAPSAYYNSVLLHTTDGGQNWNRVKPLDGYDTFRTVAFVGETGWIVGSPCKPGQLFKDCSQDKRALLRTGDGGETWAVATESPQNFTPDTVAFADAQLGYGTARCLSTAYCDLRVWRTEDGGETWTELPGSPTQPITLRIAPNGNVWITAYFCGQYGCPSVLAHSRDEGETWIEQPLGEGYVGVLEVTSTHAILRAPADAIERFDLTSGARSAAQTPLRPGFWHVAFDPGSNATGYAAAYGAFQVTDDGGRTWQRLQQPAQLQQTFPVRGSVVWASADLTCEECPTLYRTADGGRTWSGLDGPWWFVAALQAADGDRAWVTADNGLWRTDDGGTTWRKLEDGNSAGDYHFVDRDFGYSRTCGPVFCAEGTFRATFDGGMTWESRPLPLSDGLTFVTPDTGFAMRFEASLVGATCPCTYPLIRTTDGGRTWHDVTRLSTHLSNLTFIDAQRGWATGFSEDPPESTLLSTSDGGVTWKPELSLPNYVYMKALTLHGDRLTLHAGLGQQGTLNDQTFLYERVVDVAVPPIAPPNTGTGNHDTARPWTTFAVGVLGFALLAAGMAVRREREDDWLPGLDSNQQPAD